MKKLAASNFTAQTAQHFSRKLTLILDGFSLDRPGTWKTLPRVLLFAAALTVLLLLNDAIRPAHIVYATAPDGTGTMTVSPTTALAGATNQNLTFTYTAIHTGGGLNNGEIDITLPTGWSGGTVSATGGTGSNTATLTGGVIKVTGINIGSDGVLTINYNGATVGSTLGPNTFATKEKSTVGGTLTSLSSSPSVTVQQAPAITSANSATFTVGSAGSFTVTATGYPTPTLSESGALPSGITFNTSTGVLSGTPATSTGGVYPITFTAQNGIGSDATQAFTLTVQQAPAITSANNTTFTVGTAGSFNVTATGYPAPTFSKIGTLPSGVTLSSAGVLSGTPAADTGGSYSITITASNGVGTAATQAFTLTVDEAAAITSADNATFTVGSAGSFTVTASGYPMPTLAEIGALPSGITFNPATGVLSGTPAAGTGGVYPLTWTAHNNVGTDATQSFTLTVNQAAAITSANTAEFTTGTASSFTVTATGYPTPSLSETGSLPSGVTFNTTTGVLSGTPAAGTGGVYPITFTAQNGVGSDATQSFTLTVGQAPAITSGNSTTFTVGSAGSFTVTATGYPAPTFGETGALPSGVTLNSNGLLSGTPAQGSGGVYAITLTAANGVGSNATQTFTLTVDEAPAITSANNATFTVGSSGSFNVTAIGYPAPILGQSGTLPNGLSFNATTGVLSGTPAAGTGAVHSITFTASNGIGSDATQTFTLTVNQAPAITSANNTTFTVGAAGSFTVTGTGYPAPLLGESGALPSGVTFNPTTGVLSGTPAAGTGGVYPITFTASNGVSPVANQTFTLTIEEAAAITSANNAIFTVGASGQFTVIATGHPAPTLHASGTLPNGVTFDDGDGILSGIPAAGTGGDYTIIFTAHNGVGANATQTFTLTVQQAPTITSANNTTFTVGTAGAFNVTATGYPAPTFSKTGTLPSGVTLSSAGVLSGTPAANTGGSYPITITATNGVGTAATQAFTLTVDEAAAITSVDNATFVVGTAGSFTVTTRGYPKPTLSESGALPGSISFIDNGNGTATLSGTPAAGTGASYSLTLTAHNGVGSDATQSFLLTVNQAPAITSANNATFTVGTAGSFNVTATGYPAPTFGKTGTLPSGVTLSSAGVLSGTPDAGSGGIYSFTITASNGAGADATQTFTLTVNEAAALTSANTTTFVVGTAGSFTVTTGGYPKPTVSKSGALPGGVSFADNGNGTATIAGTPAAGTGASYSLTLTAHNGVGADATQTFTLVVNQAPVITSANNATFTVGSAGSFNVTATGYPGPSFGSTPLPSGLALDTATGVLSGTPAASTGGSYSITITASNGVGTAATQTFTLTINEAAAITSLDHTTFAVGTAGSFLVTVSGFPVPTLSNSGELPNGVSLNTSTGLLSGTPATGTGGTYSISLSAQNGVGSGATQVFILTINEAPAVITHPADLVVNLGQTASFSAAATGMPAPTIQWYVSTDGGTTWNPIAGETTNTLAFNAQDSDHDRQYGAAFTNSVGTATTTVARLTVNTPPSITTSPTNQAACDGSNASFSAGATGRPSPTVQWQVSANGGSTWSDISGAHSTTLSVTANSASDGNQFRAVFTNIVNSTTTNAATLHVNLPPSITTQPVSQIAVHGQSVSLSVAASGANPAPTVQWQVSTDGGATFTNLSGANSNTLTFNATVGDNGKQYRAVLNNVCSTVTSSAATLTVNKAQTTTALASSVNPVQFGKPVTLTATVSITAPGSGTPTGTITFKDGQVILGTGTLNTQGVATLTIAALSSGSHSITAQYAGDSNVTNSTSSALVQVVGNPPTYLYLPFATR